MDINKVIFSRIAPPKKLDAIEKMSQTETLQTSYDTILKIVKEIGYNGSSNRNKILGIKGDIGNDWNSFFLRVEIYKGKLFFDLYVQYSNTDTTKSVYVADFLRKGSYMGCVLYNDRCGNPQTAYFTYDESDKAKCIKAILHQYVTTKYAIA